MAITSQDYEAGLKDPDIATLPGLKDIEKKSETAHTKICKCGFINACTSNHCGNPECKHSQGWTSKKNWRPGYPDATITD